MGVRLAFVVRIDRREACDEVPLNLREQTEVVMLEFAELEEVQARYRRVLVVQVYDHIAHVRL